MSAYVGVRLAEGCEVYVETDYGKTYPLPLRLEIRNHSPSGFEWGYCGSGPAQLALSILADHFGPDRSPEKCPFCDSKMEDWQCKANECGYDGEKEDKWKAICGQLVRYQDFKEQVVAKFPRGGFRIDGKDIANWATSQVKARTCS